MKKYKNLIFDVGDVLLDYRWKEMLMDFGLSEEDALRVGTFLFKDNDNDWRDFDLGVAPEKIIERYSRKYPGDKKVISWFIRHGEYMHVARPLIWDLVHRLKECGYGIYLLSNYSETLFKKHTEYADFMQDIDGLMVSYMIGKVKPEAPIYYALLEKYGLNAQECLFFDDRLDNVNGAKAVGIDAIQVTSQQQLAKELQKLITVKLADTPKSYRAELVGAFGCPIDENPTGVMEEAAFASAGLDYRYLTVKVEKEDIETAMKAVRALQMRGINLTIPHKVTAMKYVDELSPEAQIIGAINVVVNNDGVLLGDNTDGKGFLKSLTDRGISVKGKYITVLGAGGAARAISVVCALNGASHIDIINGSESRGMELVRLLNEKTPADARLISWKGTPAIADQTDVLVNATSVGLFPNVDQKPDIDYDTVRPGMVVCDVIFNDPNSLFLQEAGKRGAVTVNGLGMLANQGALNFTLWTGKEAPVDVMEETLRREFGV